MEIIKKAALFADSILETVTLLVQRAETSGDTYKSSDATGRIAEVCVSVPANGTGEVLLSLGRGLHNYPARAATPGQTFATGTRVRVAKVGGQTIYVTALEDDIESDDPKTNSDIVA